MPTHGCILCSNCGGACPLCRTCACKSIINVNNLNDVKQSFKEMEDLNFSAYISIWLEKRPDKS